MWRNITALFKGSLTILWARAVMLIGIAVGVLQAVDVTPLLDPKWAPVYLVAMGIVTELARRRSLVGGQEPGRQGPADAPSADRQEPGGQEPEGK